MFLRCHSPPFETSSLNTLNPLLRAEQRLWFGVWWPGFPMLGLAAVGGSEQRPGAVPGRILLLHRACNSLSPSGQEQDGTSSKSFPSDCSYRDHFLLRTCSEKLTSTQVIVECIISDLLPKWRNCRSCWFVTIAEFFCWWSDGKDKPLLIAWLKHMWDLWTSRFCNFKTDAL